MEIDWIDEIGYRIGVAHGDLNLLKTEKTPHQVDADIIHARNKQIAYLEGKIEAYQTMLTIAIAAKAAKERN